MATHQNDSKKPHNINNKLYKKMRDVGLDKWGMVPLLTLACDRKTILGFEKEWCQVLNTDLNTNLPIGIDIDKRRGTKRKYHEDNKEVINKRVLCDICKTTFTRTNIYNHEKKSPKHQYALLDQVD